MKNWPKIVMVCRESERATSDLQRMFADEPHPIPEFASDPRPSIITNRYRLGILVGAFAASLFYGIAHIAFAAIGRLG